MNPEGTTAETVRDLWEAYYDKSRHWASNDTTTTSISSMGTVAVKVREVAVGRSGTTVPVADVYWVTKSGVEMRPEDMDREHRENVLNLVLRKLEEQYVEDVQVYGRDRVDGQLSPEQIEKKCLKKMLTNPALALMWKLNGYGTIDEL